MMEKKSQVGIIVGPGKGLWLIHHMIANDHPWSSMTIYVDPESKTSWAPALVTYPSTFSGVPFHLLPEDVDLLVGFVQFKLCFLLSDLVFTRSTLGGIKTLVSNALSFSPVLSQDLKKSTNIPFHLHSLKLFPEFVHLSGVLVSLGVTAGQGLLDLVELLLEAKHQFQWKLPNNESSPEYSHFPIGCFPVWLAADRSRLAISRPREVLPHQIREIQMSRSEKGYDASTNRNIDIQRSRYPWLKRGY